MWSFFVVLLEPLFCLLSHFVQGLKHEHVEHRFAVAAIESFDKAILHRLAWFDELESYAMLLGPVSQRDGDEFGTVVRSHLEGIAAHSGYALKDAYHSFSGQAEINFDRQRFAIEVVDHIESAKATTIP